ALRLADPPHVVVQELDPDAVVAGVLAARAVALGRLVGEVPGGERRDVPVAAVRPDGEGRRVLPEQEEERGGERRGDRRERRCRPGAERAGGEEPERRVEGEEVAVANGPAAAVEVERAHEEKTAGREEDREGEGPPAAPPGEGEEPEEERQEVGQDPDVPAEDEVERVPGPEVTVQVGVDRTLLGPGGVAPAAHRGLPAGGREVDPG